MFSSSGSVPHMLGIASPVQKMMETVSKHQQDLRIADCQILGFTKQIERTKSRSEEQHARNKETQHSILLLEQHCKAREDALSKDQSTEKKMDTEIRLVANVDSKKQEGQLDAAGEDKCHITGLSHYMPWLIHSKLQRVTCCMAL